MTQKEIRLKLDQWAVRVSNGDLMPSTMTQGVLELIDTYVLQRIAESSDYDREVVENINLACRSDIESEYVDPKTGKRLYNEAAVKAKVLEARIEQSWRCRELVEANRNNNEDGEYYGDVVLLDVDDLKDELATLQAEKEK